MFLDEAILNEFAKDKSLLALKIGTIFERKLIWQEKEKMLGGGGCGMGKLHDLSHTLASHLLML